MRQVEIEPVDERDSNWEVPTPRFRVYLHGSGPDETYGRTWTYDITGADALQAIDWAQRQAGDRLTYALALVLDDPTLEQRNPGHGRGLVWLVGMDGNDNTENDPEQRAVQQRMLMRRTKPVVIAPADAVPPEPSTHLTTVPMAGPYSVDMEFAARHQPLEPHSSAALRPGGPAES